MRGEGCPHAGGGDRAALGAMQARTHAPLPKSSRTPTSTSTMAELVRPVAARDSRSASAPPPPPPPKPRGRFDAATPAEEVMGGQARGQEKLSAAEESERGAPALASSWAMALPRPPPPPEPCPPTGRIMKPAAVAVPTIAAPDCATPRPEAGANDGAARPGETPPAADALKRCGAPSALKWTPARASRCFCLESFVSRSVARAGACATATPPPPTSSSSSSSAGAAAESSKGEVPGTAATAAAEKSTAGASQSSPAAATARALRAEAAPSSCGCSQAPAGGGACLAGEAAVDTGATSVASWRTASSILARCREADRRDAVWCGERWSTPSGSAQMW